MAITVQTFKANESQMEILVISDAPLSEATLVYTDGTTEDILIHFGPGAGVDEYEAIIPGTQFKDGVFTLDTTNDNADNLRVSICNLLVGHQWLLSKVLKEEYDCILMQQLEAIRQLVIAIQGDTASTIYVDVQNKVACEDNEMFDFHIEKTNVWIEENKFVII